MDYVLGAGAAYQAYKLTRNKYKSYAVGEVSRYGYKKLSEKLTMAPSSPKRGRTISRDRKQERTPGKSPKPRPYRKKTRRSTKQAGVPRGKVAETGTTIRAAKVKNTLNKKVSNKKKKKVTVSKNFKLKVVKALENKMPKGKYLEIENSSHLFPVSLGNRQQPGRFGMTTINSLGGSSQILFSPSMILDAASVLFNGKTATANSKATVTAGVYNFGANSFNPRNTKIHVLNSYTSFVIRNNSGRTWIITLYECSPKQKMNLAVEFDCLEQWSNCLTNEAAVPPFPINLAGTATTTLYANPMQNKMLKQKWNFERHDIILDPGQTYDHSMQGPSNYVYDYAKFWKADASGTADIFYDIAAPTRQLLFTARLDLVQDVAKQGGRHGYIDGATQFGRLLVETKNYYHIECPEMTGGQMSGTTAAQGATTTVTGTLDYKRDVYFHKHWQDTEADGADVRMNPETQTDNIS